MIDYSILHQSTEFYAARGFQRIEVPWAISEYCYNLTKPEGATPFQFKHNNKCFAASAEQSFLYLYLKDFLPKGQFQAITPCLRYEDFDFTHSKYFVKNELIKTDNVDRMALADLVDKALAFYKQFLPDAYIITTAIGCDIEWRGTELGSYGIRYTPFLPDGYIYGTGCAEPRLSNLIKAK